MKLADAKMIELIEAIDLLRSAGWTVEPPAAKRGTTASRTGMKRVGRPPKKSVGRLPQNGRRKRGRPPKKTT